MRVQTQYYDDYSGGLNDTVAKSEIRRNEASVLRNWDITYKGQLRRRDGLIDVGSFSLFSSASVSPSSSASASASGSVSPSATASVSVSASISPSSSASSSASASASPSSSTSPSPSASLSISQSRSASASPSESFTSILGFASYLQTDGTKDRLLMNGSTLCYYDNPNWRGLDDGFTPGNDFAFTTVSYNDKVYFCNQDNTIHSWDRASTTFNGCLTDLGSSIPHGNCLVWHKNHMFTANNVKVGSDTYENRIYWSAFGDPTTWDTTNDFINLPGGGRIISLVDAGEMLVIFKERSYMFLTGWGDTDWQVTATASKLDNIDESVGMVSPKGATRVGEEIWFMDDEGQIRKVYKTGLDVWRRDIISTKLQGTISGINKSQLAKVTAWTYNDKVYFSVPNGSDAYNSLVLVYDIIASKRTKEEAWTTYTGWYIDFAITYPTSATPDLFLADATNLKVYKHDGDDDDGVAIDARWDGKDDDFDNPETYKRYRFGHITGEAGASDVDVAVYASVEDGDFADLGDLNLKSVGGTLGPTGKFELGPTGKTAILAGPASGELRFLYTSGGGVPYGRSIRHSIRHNVLNEQPVVNGYTCHFKEKLVR